MGNANYVKGRSFEYDCMKRWKENKHVCARSSGSHGVWDVCAVQPGSVVTLIQCKVVMHEADAHKMLRDFKETPPLPYSKCYHQCLEVKVQGSTKVLSVTV